MTVIAPPLRPMQAAAWHALFDLHDRLPTGWALVGGQMVQSLCWERGALPNRPTHDADTALDVRARPRRLLEFTTALRELGFVADGESFEGHQHRWVRGGAQIDVLIPRFLGERAAGRRGATGGRRSQRPAHKERSGEPFRWSSSSTAGPGSSLGRRCRVRCSRRQPRWRSSALTQTDISRTSPPWQRWSLDVTPSALISRRPNGGESCPQWPGSVGIRRSCGLLAWTRSHSNASNWRSAPADQHPRQRLRAHWAHVWPLRRLRHHR